MSTEAGNRHSCQPPITVCELIASTELYTATFLQSLVEQRLQREWLMQSRCPKNRTLGNNSGTAPCSGVRAQKNPASCRLRRAIMAPICLWIARIGAQWLLSRDRGCTSTRSRAPTKYIPTMHQGPSLCRNSRRNEFPLNDNCI